MLTLVVFCVIVATLLLTVVSNLYLSITKDEPLNGWLLSLLASIICGLYAWPVVSLNAILGLTAMVAISFTGLSVLSLRLCLKDGRPLHGWSIVMAVFFDCVLLYLPYIERFEEYHSGGCFPSTEVSYEAHRLLTFGHWWIGATICAAVILVLIYHRQAIRFPLGYLSVVGIAAWGVIPVKLYANLRQAHANEVRRAIEDFEYLSNSAPFLLVSDKVQYTAKDPDPRFNRKEGEGKPHLVDIWEETWHDGRRMLVMEYSENKLSTPSFKVPPGVCPEVYEVPVELRQRYYAWKLVAFMERLPWQYRSIASEACFGRFTLQDLATEVRKHGKPVDVANKDFGSGYRSLYDQAIQAKVQAAMKEVSP